MDNIQTLLAAVAQTQGFDDDDSFASTPPPPPLGLKNSTSSLEVQVKMGEPEITAAPLEIADSNLPPVVEVAAIGATVVKRKRGRPPKGCSMAAKLPPEKKTRQFEDEEVDVAKRKRGRPAKGYMEAKILPEKVTRQQEDEGEDVVKRKRGRPAKGYLVSQPPPEKENRQQEDEEEDVCFICFDGGSLVLCDRKGCPKAYHMQCIQRDEAFFETKSKWNCGWHICSVCRKTSHFMCFTCTYSLCKGCIKNADYLCVRGNKGFCSTCMKTIMLIESKDQAKNDSLQVDFDDQTSWEYLFKMYWIYLKDKLSLTLFELTQAAACKPHLSNVPPTLIDGKNSEYLEYNKLQKDSSISQNDRLSLEASGTDTLNRAMEQDVPSYNKDAEQLRIDEVTAEPSLEKGTNEPGDEKITDNQDIEKDTGNPTTVKDIEKPCYKSGDEPREENSGNIFNNTEWASKDLLEFVAHMKNNDKSALSQNDLQILLLDYIDRHNLRDQKGQIICDQMLKNLFGKAHVCHIEMVKLLEFHYLKKEDPQKNSFVPAGFVGSSASNMEVVGNKYASQMPVKNRKRKTHKKSKDKTHENNLDEYAAIDYHNINLIYLHRNLMENLIEDKANFKDKVVGSIVRIKISCNDQKPDFHRLVQVVGTSKVAEPYKVGDRTTDIMLEVLNLYKKEEIAIDAISDQEFTEDECKRLRQSIRCGLVKQFTVDEVQKKAIALQPVRLTDLLEVEALQLSHLLDRAREEGHKREHRKYLRKLELLKSHEERQRRISTVPEIHADPKMSPDYDSVEDDRRDDNSKIGAYMSSSCLGFTRNEMKSSFPDKKGKEEASIDHASASHSSEDHMNMNSEIDYGNCEAMQRSVLETSTPATSIKNSPSADDVETERLWHYRDSDGKNKIQGPFSMTELRTWSTTGLLPPDMRIWTNHEQYDSLLLTDALNGQFHGASEGPHSLSSDSPEQGDTGEREGSEDINSGTSRDRQAGAVGCDNMSDLSKRNAENESGSSWPKCWDLLRNHDAIADDDVQEHGVLPSSLEETHAAQSDPEQESVEVNHGSENGEINSGEPIHNLMTSEHEVQNQSHNQGQILLTYEEILRSLSVDLSSDELETEPVYSPVSDSDDANKQDLEIDVPLKSSGFLELLSPASKSNNKDKGVGQKIEEKQIAFPEVANDWFSYSPSPSKPPVQESNTLRLPNVESENVDTSTSNNNNNQLSNASNIPNWRGMINEPIEFDALGEDSVSDLLAEVAAMESQGGFPSPNSAMKFADELIQDSKDDCFNSIDEFSPTPDPLRNDIFRSPGDVELISQSSVLYRPNIATPNGALSSFTKSVVHSTASSEAEGETNNEHLHSGEADSEFHPPAPNNMNSPTKAAGSGLEAMDNPRWGTVQGNINMVTVQGNVTLVLGGPGQGMENLGWETNPGTTWMNPRSVKGSLPCDGQRKYSVERFTSPRDRTYQGTSPRDRTYQGTSPRDRSYQGTSPRDRTSQGTSPRERTYQGSSPRERTYQGSSPRERTYQGSGDAGFGKGRPQWSRQQYGGGGGGGGGFSRSLPKGKRVCKFYESGRCRKGAFCDYLHPS